MKFLPTYTSLGAIIAAAITCSSQSLNAATQVVSNVVVNSNIGNNNSTVLPHPIPSNKATVDGTAVALAGTIPQAGDISYTGGSSLFVNTNGSGNDSFLFESTITHTVSFSLAPSEVVDINFTGNYALTSPFVSSEVSWTLTNPSAANLWSQTVTSSAGGAGILSTPISQPLTNVSGAGNYTLTLVTRVFGDYGEKNVLAVATADFTGLELNVTAAAVPEPSSSLVFGMLASCMLFSRRRK